MMCWIRIFELSAAYAAVNIAVARDGIVEQLSAAYAAVNNGQYKDSVYLSIC